MNVVMVCSEEICLSMWVDWMRISRISTAMSWAAVMSCCSAILISSWAMRSWSAETRFSRLSLLVMGKRWEKLTSRPPSEPGMDLLTPMPRVGLARVPAWLSFADASFILSFAARSWGLLLETLLASARMFRVLLWFVELSLEEKVGRSAWSVMTMRFFSRFAHEDRMLMVPIVQAVMSWL